MMCNYYATQLYRQVLLRARISYGNSVRLSVCLLLSTNLAREWLQIDTDLLRIITSTADELSGGTNVDDLE